MRAVLIDVDKEETAVVEIKWAQWGCGVPLIVLPSPYRSILGALLEYVEENLEKDPDCWITVVLPEILPARWWQNISAQSTGPPAERRPAVQGPCRPHRRAVPPDEVTMKPQYRLERTITARMRRLIILLQGFCCAGGRYARGRRAGVQNY